MWYSIQPRGRIYVKGYGFLSFANKNIDKCLSSKYGQQLLVSAKKSTTDTIKAASKRAIKKTAEATSDLIGNTIAAKITSVSKRKSTTELHSKELPINETEEEDVEIATVKKRYISPEERKQIIDQLRLVYKKYLWIKIHVSERKFIRGRKLNFSLVFITQSYFKVPEDVRLNTSHFLI